ncbi:MAG: hypothetical protein ACI9MS_003725 [Glaciecola sp.]|jgi:hypothetical protein
MTMLKTNQNREYATKLANVAKRFMTSHAFNHLIEQWLLKLQLVGTNVDVTNGVITLGKIDGNQSFANQIWVLTHLEPSFSEYNGRGKPSGYTVELVQGISTEARLRKQIMLAPWQRILNESKIKPDVLVFALARTQDTEDNFY